MKCLLAVALLLSGMAQAAEDKPVMSERRAITVTIFANDLALLREERKANLAVGDNTVVFDDVAEGVQVETALVAGDSIVPMELSTDPLLTPRGLLRRAVGTDVTLMRPLSNGGEKAERVRLLSVRDGLVVEVAGRIEANPSGYIVLDGLPTRLLVKPAVTARLRTTAAGPHDLTVSYLAKGFSWRPDYVAELNDEDGLRLSGWATVANRSGAAWQNAHLLLTSARPEHPAVPGSGVMMNERVAVASAPAGRFEPPAAEEAAGEVFWDMGQAVTLEDGQIRQFALLPAAALTVETVRRLDGLYLAGGPQGGPLTRLPRLALSFTTPREVSLPAGVVHVYRRDEAGNLHFMGDSNLAPTAAGGPAKLTLGIDVNLPVVVTETDFHREGTATEAAYAVTGRNVSAQAARLEVAPSLPPGWSVIDESGPHETRGGLPVWSLTVAGKGEATLSLRLRVVPPPQPKPR